MSNHLTVLSTLYDFVAPLILITHHKKGFLLYGLLKCVTAEMFKCIGKKSNMFNVVVLFV